MVALHVWMCPNVVRSRDLRHPYEIASYTAGSMPGAKQSMILVGTRLTEVRGFSDFFSEFFTALRKTQFPPNMRMVVLCNRPNYELRAFQVLIFSHACAAQGIHASFDGDCYAPRIVVKQVP